MEQDTCLNPWCSSLAVPGKDVCRECRQRLIDERNLTNVEREAARKAEYAREKARKNEHGLDTHAGSEGDAAGST